MDDGPIFLVVEDDLDVLDLIARALARPDRTVLTAPSAEEALALFERFPGRFAVVVSDVVLPDLSGPAMVRRMLESQPALPALFVSGYPRESVAGQMEGLPFHFLPKPFTVAKLRAAVLEAMNGTLISAFRA